MENQSLLLLYSLFEIYCSFLSDIGCSSNDLKIVCNAFAFVYAGVQASIGPVYEKDD
jgi:hypothetical protein